MESFTLDFNSHYLSGSPAVEAARLRVITLQIFAIALSDKSPRSLRLEFCFGQSFTEPVVITEMVV